MKHPPRSEKPLSKEMNGTLDMMKALYRKNGVSIKELSRMTGWTPQAIQSILRDLQNALEEGKENAHIVQFRHNGETVYKIQNISKSEKPDE